MLSHALAATLLQHTHLGLLPLLSDRSASVVLFSETPSTELVVPDPELLSLSPRELRDSVSAVSSSALSLSPPSLSPSSTLPVDKVS